MEHTSQRASRVGPSTESEQADAVTPFVVLHEEVIPFDNLEAPIVKGYT